MFSFVSSCQLAFRQPHHFYILPKTCKSGFSVLYLGTLWYYCFSHSGITLLKLLPALSFLIYQHSRRSAALFSYRIHIILLTEFCVCHSTEKSVTLPSPCSNILNPQGPLLSSREISFLDSSCNNHCMTR